MSGGQPSETSPLLGARGPYREPADPQVEGSHDASQRIDVEPNGEASAPAIDVTGRLRDGDDQQTEEDHPAQHGNSYQGIPEVREKLKFIVPAISIGIFLAAADQTLVASSAGKIGSDLNALKNTSWIATSYFLTLTSFQPLYGKLSDIFTRKGSLLSAYLIFAFGCLWCGTATTMESLILARAFAGIGGGGMTTCVSIIMSDIVPLRERGTWQGIINIVFAAGSGIGAPLGGYLSDTIGWQWAFTGQFPICILAFACCYFALNLPHEDKQNWKVKLKRIDFPGAATLVGSVTLLLVGLDQGSNESWTSPVTVGCLGACVPLVLCFCWIEAKVAAEPFAPGRIIFERSQFAAYCCCFFGFAGWFGLLFYLPLFFQGVLDLNATQSGLRLLPGIVASVIGSLVSGLLMQRTGKYFWLTVGTYIILTLGVTILLLCTGPVIESSLGIAIGLALSGLGAGSSVTVSLIALLSVSTTQDQAITTACSYLFRSLGSVVGLSIQSAVFQNMLRLNLLKGLGDGQEARDIAERIRESLDYIRTLDPGTRAVVRKAYQSSTHGVFGLVIGFCFLAVISACFIREKKLGG